MKRIIITICLVSAVAAAGCSASGETASLKSTKWQLDSLSSITLPVMAKKPDIEFNAAGKVGGFGGCNTYGGSYSTSGDKLTTSELFATEMACDNLEIEKTFLNAVQKSDTYKVKDSKLYLYKGKELKAILTKIN